MKDKKILTTIGMFFLLGSIGLVSAKSGDSTGAFDLFYLLVENVFGNILVAGIGVGLIIIFIAMISNMSTQTMTSILIAYSVTFLTGYAGIFWILITLIVILLLVELKVMDFLEGK